jgi:hypothetical protein
LLKINQIISNTNYSNEINDFRSIIYKIKNDCITRWSSLFNLIDRIILIWIPICRTLISKGDKHLYEDIGKDYLDELISILSPFHDITLFFEKKYSSVDHILPKLFQIKKILNDFKPKIEEIQNYKKEIEKKLEIEINEYLKNDSILIATFLNPLTKNLKFINSMRKLQIMKIINDYYENTKKENVHIFDKNKIILDTDIYDDFDENDNEIEKYLIDKTFDNKISPLNWWYKNKSNYSILYTLAIKYLIIPATSTQDERENSNLG